MAAVLRSTAIALLAATAGALSALVGTSIHLWTVRDGSLAWPVGFVLAVALVVSVDTAVAAGTRSAAVLLAVTAGRTVALGALVAPGPGGNVVLVGAWQSEAWALTAILLPGLAAPLVSAWASIRRSRVRAQASTAVLPAPDSVPVGAPAPPGGRR